MAEQTSSGTDQPINYGMGTGWLDYYNLLSQMLTQQGAAQGATGTSTLSQLSQLLTNPASGPLGLAATAAYGNPQGIAAATGGKGINTDAYTSRYDKLLDALVGYSSNINKTANDIPLKVDPNKAPAPTPENAAQAPNVARDWVAAWNAYHPGEKSPLSAQYGLKDGGIIASIAEKMLGGTVPGYREGGAVATPVPGTSGPAASPLQPVTYRAAMPGSETLHQSLNKPAVDPYAAFGGADLVNSMTKFVAGGGDPNKFIKTIQSIGKLSDLVSSGKIPVATPSGGVPGAPAPNILSLGADYIRSLLGEYGQMVGFPGFADGGVTLAGQPHWIVDDNGYPVAAITEDGQPENVRGLKNGGVEVTPLRPDRYEAYTGQSTEGDQWGRMLARMLPSAQQGQEFLFPDIPNSGVDTSIKPGTNMIPTMGGPLPQKEQSWYGKGTSPKDLTDLMKMTADAPGKNYSEQFASLLGGALARNTTMGEAVKALNQQKAPTNLPSAQQFGTMTPTQRAAYTAMLQQMGIIASPEDLNWYLQQGRPD